MTPQEAFDLYEQNFRTADALREHAANTGTGDLAQLQELARQAELLRDRARNAILDANLPIVQGLMADFARTKADSETALARLQQGVGAIGAVSNLLSIALNKGSQAIPQN